jgi:hypothetical protein
MLQRTPEVLLLAGITALFLATGAARATEDALVLLQRDDKSSPYYTFISVPMSCLELLERHEINRKAGTWLSWAFKDEFSM